VRKETKEVLTPRQQQVIMLSSRGMTYKEISLEMDISERVIQRVVRRAKKILCAKTLPQLIVLYREYMSKQTISEE